MRELLSMGNGRGQGPPQEKRRIEAVGVNIVDQEIAATHPRYVGRAACHFVVMFVSRNHYIGVRRPREVCAEAHQDQCEFITQM